MIDRARAQGPLLLVDTGNVFASPYVWSRQGNRKVETYLAGFYKREGYQAVALGWGDYRALEQGVGRDLPWVSANVRVPGVRPFRVVKVGPWRVAVTAVTGKGSFSSAMEWEKPEKALARVLKELAGKRVDVVLLLMPSPAVKGIFPLGGVDLALGGVYGRGKVRREGPPYVFWLRKVRGGQMGLITLEKTSTGVKLVSSEFYILDSRIPGDSQVTREIKELLK